jgi:hypothetical protein
LYRPARITKGGAISKLAGNRNACSEYQRGSIKVIEANDLGSNGFTYAVKRQSHVSFVKLGVGSNGTFHTFHNSLDVSKHVGPVYSDVSILG